MAKAWTEAEPQVTNRLAVAEAVSKQWLYMQTHAVMKAIHTIWHLLLRLRCPLWPWVPSRRCFYSRTDATRMSICIAKDVTQRNHAARAQRKTPPCCKRMHAQSAAVCQNSSVLVDHKNDECPCPAHCNTCMPPLLLRLPPTHACAPFSRCDSVWKALGMTTSASACKADTLLAAACRASHAPAASQVATTTTPSHRPREEWW